MRAPSGLHRASSHIEAYFDDNPTAWVVGIEYEPWTQLLREVGVSDHPKITARRPDRLRYVEIASAHGWHERGVDGFDPDARIEELEWASVDSATVTSGGSSDSDENADTVIPTGPAAVTTVTPLAHRASVALKSSGVTLCSSATLGW